MLIAALPYNSPVDSVSPAPSRFIITTLHAVSFCSIEAKGTNHPSVPDLIILMTFGEQ
jgi:hypothetical protein